MTDPLLDTLRNTFGFHDFQGLQRPVVEQVTGGGDALVLMPTGGGKSLCYQLPALVMDGVCLVVSPLIALMRDQVQALRQMGVRAAYINSSIMPQEAAMLENQMVEGGLDLVYVAPERLLKDRFLNLLDQTKVALFAIDEAHCASQWGHDFRPEYLQLDVLRERWPAVPRLALTATADGPTRKDIAVRLRFEDAKVFAAGFDRPNLRYTVQPKNNARRQLLSFIKEHHEGDSGIVYRMSRKKVEACAEWLTKKGVPALPYHAGMTPLQRQRNQDRFMNEEGLTIVATVAFGMGIDKPNVRYVAHLDPPKSLEAYHQETGRAGRDGLPADAWMTFGLADVGMLRAILESGEADADRKRIESQKLTAMLGYCETIQCRRTALLGYFGEPHPGGCGNCDNCLTPVDTWDGTIAAQKALSAVYRTGQTFGAGYLSDILLGKATDRVMRFGHDSLKTFGCGDELDKRGWMSVFRQLAAAGFVRVDIEGHGGLKLTDLSWEVLRSEREVTLRKDPEHLKRRRKRNSRRATANFEQLNTDEARDLFEILRTKRMEIAKTQGVPPYAVFPDKTLLDMVTVRPRSKPSFATLHGVGATKLTRYADLFLETLAEYEAEHGRPEGLPEPPPSQEETTPPPAKEKPKGLSATQRTTLDLWKELGDVAAVAETRKLAPGTIWGHLLALVLHGEVDATQAAGLAEKDANNIRIALGDRPESVPLPAIFEAFGGRYTYDQLRLVRAGMERDKSNESKKAT